MSVTARGWGLRLTVMLPAQERGGGLWSSRRACVCISLWMGFLGSGWRFGAIQARPVLEHRTRRACRRQSPPSRRHRVEPRLVSGCCPSAGAPSANWDGPIHHWELAAGSRPTSVCGAQQAGPGERARGGGTAMGGGTRTPSAVHPRDGFGLPLSCMGIPGSGAGTGGGGVVLGSRAVGQPGVEMPHPAPQGSFGCAPHQQQEDHGFFDP